MHEIITLLEDEKEATAPSTSVILIPDPEEPYTDEDSEDEEDTGGRGMDVNHLGRGLLNQVAEIIVNNVPDDLPDVTDYDGLGEIVATEDETMDMEVDGEQVEQEEQDQQQNRRGEKRKRVTREVPQLKRVKNKDRQWFAEPPADFGKKVPAFQPAPAPTVPDDCFIPYDFLRQFLTPDFVDSVSVKSKLYCLRKGGSDEKQSTMSSDNILASIAIMFLTGYLSPAQKDMFWNDRLDTQNLIAKKALSRNRFLDVCRFTYFSVENDMDPDDSFWKVRSLFDHINLSAKEKIEQPEWVSVDESMIRYFGPHPLKQRIAEKPER